jgi:hypothetical protein
MIFGSHDSCACTIKNKSYCICWIWAKTQDISLKDQYKLGIRLFDIRYHFYEMFYTSHTFSTSYTIKDAITELVQCSKEENDYIFIRLKRDSSSPGLPSFGSYLSSLTINNEPLSSYVIEYDGSTLWSFMDKKPVDSHRIIFYSDDESLLQDNVCKSWIFPQLFDTIETWGCSNIEEATQLIIQKKFKENGLPKAIFLDFSSIFPPEIAHELLWYRVQTYIKDYIDKNEIQCLVMNQILEHQIL